MALTLGFVLVGGILVKVPSARMLQLASLFAGAWWFLVVLQVPLTVSEVLALPWSGSLDPTIAWSLLSRTTLGQVILIQLVLVGVVALLAWATRARVGLVIVVLLAMSAAFLPGFTGHSSMAGGHTSATVSLGLHLVTVGLWVGGVVALAGLVSVDRGQADAAIRRFSSVALICVILMAETGLLNAAMRMQSLSELVTSQYGAIILAKCLVLTILIGFGWKHRVLLRSLAAGTAPPNSATCFLRLIGLEVIWMSVAIGLAVALSRTAPPGGVVGDTVAPGVLVLIGVGIRSASYESDATDGLLSRGGGRRFHGDYPRHRDGASLPRTAHGHRLLPDPGCGLRRDCIRSVLAKLHRDRHPHGRLARADVVDPP
jgi:putative copper resistance protein D